MTEDLSVGDVEVTRGPFEIAAEKNVDGHWSAWMSGLKEVEEGTRAHASTLPLAVSLVRESWRRLMGQPFADDDFTVVVQSSFL